MIEIVDYKQSWPGEYAVIRQSLADAAGKLALRIDHIGSTAVPGLAAKDRIDIQITIASQSDFEAVRSALEGIGYTQADITCDHVPPDGPAEAEQWLKRFFRPPAGQRPTNLHVRIHGRANQRYPLLFRDYLRANQAAAKAYESLKKQLARYHGDDTEAYCDIKDPACDLIAIAAESWAKSTGWRPLEENPAGDGSAVTR